MAFGLLPTGFVAKTLTDIKTGLEAHFRAVFGASINLTAKSNFSQLIGAVSERLAELWEVAQGVDSAFDPDKAEGAQLDAICAITGTIRKPATASTGYMTIIGVTGTPFSPGRVASVDVVGTKFETINGGTIVAVSAWAPSTAYGIGALVKNAGNVYLCTDDGTSAGSGGPATSATSIADGSCVWRYLGVGDGATRVAMKSSETGPKIAAAFTLNNIETPVSGWNAVTNEEDAILGEDVESDADLRLRRELELLGASASVIDSIRTKLTRLEGVTSVTVFQNDTEATNSDGMPPHSVEALVRGGLDQDIRETIWHEGVAAGITSYGNTSGTVTDADNGGQTYTVKFSRPVEKNVYVVVNVVKNPLTFPADGAAQIRDAIVAHGAAYSNGRDVHARAVAAAPFAVKGVINVTAANIGLAPAPATETSITIALRELAVFDSARITVNVSDGTP